MALLSIPHEYPLFNPPGLPKHPAYLDKTEIRWVDCPQEELDKLSLPVIKSYLADGKIPLKYAERAFLDSGRKLALGSAALGLCVAAGVMYNFDMPESNLTEAAVSLGIGVAASGIHTNIVIASNILADEFEIYGPLSRWRAHQQTKHVKQLIGDRHQAATATTYELRSLIAEHNRKLDPLYHLEDSTTTLAPILDQVVPEKSEVITAFEKDARASYDDGLPESVGDALRDDITRAFEPVLASVYAKNTYLVDAAQRDKKDAAAQATTQAAANAQREEQRAIQLLGYDPRLFNELEPGT